MFHGGTESTAYAADDDVEGGTEMKFYIIQRYPPLALSLPALCPTPFPSPVYLGLSSDQVRSTR
jgi:hypothetical protein